MYGKMIYRPNEAPDDILSEDARITTSVDAVKINGDICIAVRPNFIAFHDAIKNFGGEIDEKVNGVDVDVGYSSTTSLDIRMQTITQAGIYCQRQASVQIVLDIVRS